MPVNWQIDVFQKVETTQSLVKTAASQGKPEGYGVQAMQQTIGKGRHGNQWDSPIGNLYLSILLRPDCALEEAGQLSFVVAVALSAALDEYIDPAKDTKTLKWPNDILVNKLKLSGILLESEIKENKLDSVIIGMGLNIFTKPELAICLNDVATEPVYINKVRDTALDKLSYFYSVWQEKGFAPILEAWLKQAHGLGEPMTARLPKATHKGVFKGVTPEGSLILEQENGKENIIHAADVYFGENT